MHGTMNINFNKMHVFKIFFYFYDVFDKFRNRGLSSGRRLYVQVCLHVSGISSLVGENVWKSVHRTHTPTDTTAYTVGM